jgi:outer membrane cobalamin receptor
MLHDVTEDFLINGTVRYEDYSDFGGATVWKLSSRYKFLEDKITLKVLFLQDLEHLHYTKFIHKNLNLLSKQVEKSLWINK